MRGGIFFIFPFKIHALLIFFIINSPVLLYGVLRSRACALLYPTGNRLVTRRFRPVGPCFVFWKGLWSYIALLMEFFFTLGHAPYNPARALPLDPALAVRQGCLRTNASIPTLSVWVSIVSSTVIRKLHCVTLSTNDT